MGDEVEIQRRIDDAARRQNAKAPKEERSVDAKFSRRDYMIQLVMTNTGCGWLMASEAVSTTAMESTHMTLEYMLEVRTWSEWEKEYKPARESKPARQAAQAARDAGELIQREN